MFAVQMPETELQYVVYCDVCMGKTTDVECYCGGLKEDITRYSAYEAVLKHYGHDMMGGLVNMAIEFYGAIARRRLGEGTPKDEVTIEKVADNLALAAAVSCFGEARHEMSCALHEIQRRSASNFDPATTRLGKVLARANGGGILSRMLTTPHAGATHRDDFAHNVAMDYTPQDLARFARTTFGVHTRCTHCVDVGYGGPLWWQGADLTVKYYEGRLPPVVYADLMFNTVHNNGPLISKVYFVPVPMNNLLNFKRVASAEDIRDKIRVFSLRYEDIVAANPEHDWQPLEPVTTGLAGAYVIPPQLGYAAQESHHCPRHYYAAPVPRSVTAGKLTISWRLPFYSQWLFPPGSYQFADSAVDRKQLGSWLINRAPVRVGQHPDHHCDGCDGTHKTVPEPGAMIEPCSYGKFGCLHDKAGECCCLWYETEGEHNEDCEYAYSCYSEVPGCNCAGDEYCCHQYYSDIGHDEDCYNYEPEEEDDDE